MKTPQIIVHQGELALLVPLGTSIDVPELLAMLGNAPAAQARIEQHVTMLPVEPAPEPDDRTCPECGKRCQTVRGLGVHREKAHGVTGAWLERRHLTATGHTDEPTPPPTSDVTCRECGKAYRTPHGLAVHRKRAHGLTSRAMSGPAVYPDTSEACPSCGKDAVIHDRCSDCRVLLGPDHPAGEVAGHHRGKPLCELCLTTRKPLVPA